jgi:hypothetical protein
MISQEQDLELNKCDCLCFLLICYIFQYLILFIDEFIKVINMTWNSDVWLIKKKKEDILYAIKIINIEKNCDALNRELEMRSIVGKCEFLVDIVEIIKFRNENGLVMKYYTNGDLKSFHEKKKSFKKKVNR